MTNTRCIRYGMVVQATAELPIVTRLIANRYRLITPAGYGGASVVWRAHDIRLNRDVAVKLYRHTDNETRIRARREFEVLQRLNHRAILTVLDGEPEADEPYLVLPYLSGKTLNHHIRQHHPREPQVRHWLGSVADGLRYAHHHNIWHRDIKPSNIMMADGYPIVIDWGLGKHDDMVDATQLNRIVGTAEFFAPEILRGSPADAASDVWAWGVTAYTILTGHTPFAGANLVDILHAQEHPLPSLGWSLRRWNSLFTQIFNLDPAERPDAGAVASWCGVIS